MKTTLLSVASAALAGAVISSGCGASHHATPTLGIPWAPYQAGYGRIAPPKVYNGGDPTGRVDRLSWRGWGNAKTVGTGLGWDLSRGRVRAQLIATDLGPCHGHPAY